MSGAILAALSVGPSFKASIGGGVVSYGAAVSHTFPANTAIPLGGTGPFTYVWTLTSADGWTWTMTGAATSTMTPKVAGLGGYGDVGDATVTCAITDTSNGQTVVSNIASYEYRCTYTGSGPIP